MTPEEVRDCDSLRGAVMAAAHTIMDNGINPAGMLSAAEIVEHQEKLVQCLTSLVAAALDVAITKCMQVNATATFTEIGAMQGANRCMKAIASLHEAWMESCAGKDVS